MADLDAAVGYVVAHGDVVDRARLSYLRSHTEPGPDVLDKAEDGYLPNGGWPPLASSATASVDATCFRLGEIDDLGGLDRPAARQALGWLAGSQRPDGLWRESELLGPVAPPWARPDDPEATLYLTVNAAYWLAVSAPIPHYRGDGAEHPYAGHVAMAADALQATLGPHGEWPSYLATGWLGCALLYHLGRYYESAQIQVILAERVPDLSGNDCALLAARLRRVGVPGDEWLLKSARHRLTQTQRYDGSWESDDGPAFDVHTTLTAIRAIG